MVAAPAALCGAGAGMLVAGLLGLGPQLMLLPFAVVFALGGLASALRLEQWRARAAASAAPGAFADDQTDLHADRPAGLPLQPAASLVSSGAPRG